MREMIQGNAVYIYKYIYTLHSPVSFHIYIYIYIYVMFLMYFCYAVCIESCARLWSMWSLQFYCSLIHEHSAPNHICISAYQSDGYADVYVCVLCSVYNRLKHLMAVCGVSCSRESRTVIGADLLWWRDLSLPLFPLPHSLLLSLSSPLLHSNSITMLACRQSSMWVRRASVLSFSFCLLFIFFPVQSTHSFRILSFHPVLSSSSLMYVDELYECANIINP